MATSHPIPLTYRIIFTIVDPLFCILGFATHLFAPATTMQGYSTRARIPPLPETVWLLDNMASFFAMLFVLEGVLLRYAKPRDVVVWRYVQAAGVMVDLFMVVGAVKLLSAEGRLMDVGNWRGDDWKNLVANAVMGLFRLAVALGIGMGKDDEKEHKA